MTERDPSSVAIGDQLASYDRDHARRLAMFYRELRAGGVPAVPASVAVVLHLAGYHWNRPAD